MPGPCHAGTRRAEVARPGLCSRQAQTGRLPLHRRFIPSGSCAAPGCDGKGIRLPLQPDPPVRRPVSLPPVGRIASHAKPGRRAGSGCCAKRLRSSAAVSFRFVLLCLPIEFLLSFFSSAVATAVAVSSQALSPSPAKAAGAGKGTSCPQPLHGMRPSFGESAPTPTRPSWRTPVRSHRTACGPQLRGVSPNTPPGRSRRKTLASAAAARHAVHSFEGATPNTPPGQSRSKILAPAATAQYAAHSFEGRNPNTPPGQSRSKTLRPQPPHSTRFTASGSQLLT